MQIIALIKKPIFWLIAFAAIAAVAFIAYMAFYFFIIRPTIISECQNAECVKKIVLSKNFNPADCLKAAENLRNGCYYAYEIKNLTTKKTQPGQYCWFVKQDEELGADCFYKTLGILAVTTNVKENFRPAVASLDTKNCDKLNSSGWKERCVNDIGKIKNALDAKDLSSCFKQTELSDYSSQICAGIVQEKISQDLIDSLIKKTK